jgi:hypothetical protein
MDQNSPLRPRYDQNDLARSFSVERVAIPLIGIFGATENQSPAEWGTILFNEVGVVREVLCRLAIFPHQNLLQTLKHLLDHGIVEGYGPP